MTPLYSNGSPVPGAVKGIIFDLDGTLLDTLQDLAECMNTALTSLGFPAHPADSYRYFVGRGIHRLAENVLATQPHTEVDVRKLLDKFIPLYQENWMKYTRPYEGVNHLLRSLSERKGLKLGVLSNKADHFTREMVDWYFPQGIFSVVAGAREGIPKKPEPAAALAIAAQWGLPPQEILFLGDSDVDMQTASRAGMRAAGALWGFREMEELMSNGAEYLLEQPSALLDLLEPLS